MSREEGEVELSVKSTPHLRPIDPITPFPLSILSLSLISESDLSIYL